MQPGTKLQGLYLVASVAFWKLLKGSLVNLPTDSSSYNSGFSIHNIFNSRSGEKKTKVDSVHLDRPDEQSRPDLIVSWSAGVGCGYT